MNIAIIGTGYVGLVTGACFAEMGHRVICVDLDEQRVAAVNQGVPPIHEQGLPELMRRHIGHRLCATTDLAAAVGACDLTMIAVGTPLGQDGIDLSFVQEAAKQIGKALRDSSHYHVVVVKSTVVPGTTDGVVLPILEHSSGKRAGADFGVGMNPEFLTEGQALDDFLRPDRIVLGGIDKRTIDVMEEMYGDFEGVPCLRTNTRAAEMIKYASNALLATMISFSNEIANLSSAVGGIDVVEVMEGVHESRYLTSAADGNLFKAPITSFLEAGCGFGGSCLPKDVNALIRYGQRAGVDMSMLEAVMHVNDGQPAVIMEILRSELCSLAGLRVAVLGLAFKPDTDDVRESPAIPVVEMLLNEGASVTIHDPVVAGAATVLFDGRVQVADSLEAAVADVHAVVLITRWEEYRRLGDVISALDSQPLLVDGRRMLPPDAFARYRGIGL
jgi:UDPglucose 6-dehydrogenase